jgi:hypothetical protein
MENVSDETNQGKVINDSTGNDKVPVENGDNQPTKKDYRKILQYKFNEQDYE